MAFDLASGKKWLQIFWSMWRGPILLCLVVFLFTAVAWFGADVFDGKPTTSGTTARIAITVVALFVIFGLALLVTFFWLFRGIHIDEARLVAIVNYCYAFIVFSILFSVLPFVALPLIPGLDSIMMKSPISIVAGCSLPVRLDGEENNVPKELRCKVDTEQWVVNIGGTVVNVIEKASGPQPVAPSGNQQSSASQPQDTKPEPQAPTPQAQVPTTPASVTVVQIRGGLVVPLYAVVLSLMGAVVSMTRRVPEYQRRLSPGDPEFITNDQARERLVFQIMQVASAPLIVLTAYYLVNPSSRASTIALSFASGFASETVLLMIRALVEKLQPAPAAALKPPEIRVVPARIEFGDVQEQQTLKKTITVANAGSAPIVVSVLTLTNSTDFQVTTAVPLQIAAGASANIDVEFKPAGKGRKSGQLKITDDAAGSPRIVDLAGNGT